jgi:hypothetical protein
MLPAGNLPRPGALVVPPHLQISRLVSNAPTDYVKLKRFSEKSLKHVWTTVGS